MITKKIEMCELALKELYNQRLQLESEYQKCADAASEQDVTAQNSDPLDIKYEDNYPYIGADTSLAEFPSDATTATPQQNTIDILLGIMNYEEQSFPASTSHANISSAQPTDLNLSVPNIKREFEEEHDEEEVDFEDIDKKGF